jgi:hypothetical protein
MITYRRRGVLIAEVWFDAALAPAFGVDVVHVRRSLTPIAGHQNEEAHTLLLDLTLPQDSLLDGMTKGNRYEIRRADTKDGVDAVLLTRPTEAELEAFFAFFAAFAAQKGLPALTPFLQMQMRQYRAVNLLTLTYVRQGDDTLVWHSYITQGPRCRLLQSASHFRASDDTGFQALIGRANRWLHWQDMLGFCAAGYTLYDWGGWHPGTDPALMRINQFKESFGGTHAAVYDARYGISLLGCLENTALHYAQRWQQRRKAVPAERDTAQEQDES